MNPTRYVDPTGHDFKLNTHKKYGPNDVAAPVLSGKVTHEEYQQYLKYVEKHGSREQVVAATLGAAGTYSTAYVQKAAKMEAAGAAGVAAGVPVAMAGGSAALVGAVSGGTEGLVGGLLDKASAAEIAARTAGGAVFGAVVGWGVNKLGSWIAGEASPSTPGASKTDSVAPKPASGEPAPKLPPSDGPSGLNTGPFEVPPAEPVASAPAGGTPSTNGPATPPARIQTTVGNLRSAELRDAHHVIQDAAVRDLPGYQTELAPGTPLAGPSNVRGTPHYEATQVQRQAGGGTYAAERRIAYKALRNAGLTEAQARAEIARADEYFQSIGVTAQTPTRVPGNRR